MQVRIIAIVAMACSGTPGPPAPTVDNKVAGPRLEPRKVLASKLVNPDAIVVDGTSIYVSTFSAVIELPKDGSQPPKSLTPPGYLPTALAVDAANVYVGLFPDSAEERANARAAVEADIGRDRLRGAVLR